MAYRRKQGTPRSSTYEEIRRPFAAEDAGTATAPSSLASQSQSSARRDSSLSSAYGDSAFSPARQVPSPAQNPNGHDYTSKGSPERERTGFWSILAQKAKALLEDDHIAGQISKNSNGHHEAHLPNAPKEQQRFYQLSEVHWKNENSMVQKKLAVTTTSIKYIGGRVGNAFEEVLSTAGDRADVSTQGSCKLNERKEDGSNHDTEPELYEPIETKRELEGEVKASRNSLQVSNAMAAKAKLLMRELKTVKADLAFAKQRCTQLEEENKILRERTKKGDDHEDDDLIRLQLESLLAEKARLANENSIYARENRFLREVVEFHQLNIQDVIYLDEGIEDVSEVYQYPTPSSHGALSRSPSPSSIHRASPLQPISIKQQDATTLSPIQLSPLSSIPTPMRLYPQ